MHAVKMDKPTDLVHVGMFGMNRVVMEAKILSDFIEYFWLV